MGTSDVLGDFNYPVLGRAHPMPVCDGLSQNVFCHTSIEVDKKFAKAVCVI